MEMLLRLCALSQSVDSSGAADPRTSLEPPLGTSFTFEASHLKNSQLAHEILFGQLGLDTTDLGVLVQGERAELMATLADSGLQLGDRVKLRLWMDRQSPRETHSPWTEAPMVETASEWRLQVDPCMDASQSDGATQGRGGTQDPAAPGQVYRTARRTQETTQERGKAPTDEKGLSAESIAIMVTVLLSLASYGPKGAWNHVMEGSRFV
jgi:hypothetical protein